MVKDMVKLFPDFHHIFIYRNCQEAVSSWLGIFVSVSSFVTLRDCVDSNKLAALTLFFRNVLETKVNCHVDNYAGLDLNTNTVSISTHKRARFIPIARDAKYSIQFASM